MHMQVVEFAQMASWVESCYGSYCLSTPVTGCAISTAVLSFQLCQHCCAGVMSVGFVLGESVTGRVITGSAGVGAMPALLCWVWPCIVP